MAPRRELIFVLALGALVFLVGLGRRELWNPLEPRYAGITLDMLEEGHWLVPHFRQEPYAQKPPLVFWSAAALLEAGGDRMNRFLLRLPSALGGILLLLSTWGLGRRLFGGRAGLYAALALGSCWMSFWSGRFLHLDLPFVGGATCGLWALIEAGGCERPRSRTRWSLLAWLALSGAVLVKGPPALLVVVIALVPSWTLHRDTPLVRLPRALLTLGLALLPFALWVGLAAAEAGSAWLSEITLGQGINRHLETPKPDRHGPLFYLRGFWGVFAPWSALAPGALVLAWKRRRDPNLRSVLPALITWLLGLTFLMSFSAMRRSRYLILVLPAAALLVGWWLDVAANEKSRTRWVLVTVCGLLGGVAVLLGGLLFAPDAALSLLDPTPKLQRAAEVVVGHTIERFVLGAGFLLIGALLLRALRTGRIAMAFGTACLVLGLIASSYGLLASPAIDAARRDPELIAMLRELVGEERRVLILGTYAYHESTEGWFHYYAGHHPKLLRRPHLGLDRLATEEPFVLVVRDRDLRPHKWRVDPARWTPRNPEPLGHHKLWLFTNAKPKSR